MDPLITKLNEAAQQKLTKPAATPAPTEGPSAFAQQLDNNIAERFLEKMQTENLDPSNNMTVLSGDDIKIESKNPELAKSSSSPSERYFDMFKEMNRDLLGVDAALETLTTPGLKITPRQMLTLQAGIANVQIMGEAFSKFTDAIARGIQTIVNTPLG